MLSYETQLTLKRNVIVNAYKNLSGILNLIWLYTLLTNDAALPESSVPTILPTIGSPLQYEYRTKITPHFDKPKDAAKKAGAEVLSTDGSKPDWLNIGFNMAGTRNTVMDIEVSLY